MLCLAATVRDRMIPVSPRPRLLVMRVPASIWVDVCASASVSECVPRVIGNLVMGCNAKHLSASARAGRWGAPRDCQRGIRSDRERDGGGGQGWEGDGRGSRSVRGWEAARDYRRKNKTNAVCDRNIHIPRLKSGHTAHRDIWKAAHSHLRALNLRNHYFRHQAARNSCKIVRKS